MKPNVPGALRGTPATSGGRSDLDGDLIFLEEMDQTECGVPALLCRDHWCKLNRRKNSCGATKRLPSHFPALSAHGELDVGIVGNSLDLPRTGFSGDIDFAANHIEPDWS